MTVDVKIGTVSKWRENQSEKSFFFYLILHRKMHLRAGNREMLAATWISNLAAW